MTTRKSQNILWIWAAISVIGLLAPLRSSATIRLDNGVKSGFSEVRFSSSSTVPGSNSAWLSESQAMSTFTDSVIAHDPQPIAKPAKRSFSIGLGGLPAEPSPTGARVPEPASVLLLATGLLGARGAAKRSTAAKR